MKTALNKAKRIVIIRLTKRFPFCCYVRVLSKLWSVSWVLLFYYSLFYIQHISSYLKTIFQIFAIEGRNNIATILLFCSGETINSKNRYRSNQLNYILNSEDGWIRTNDKYSQLIRKNLYSLVSFKYIRQKILLYQMV